MHLRHILAVLLTTATVTPAMAEDDTSVRTDRGALSLVESGRTPSGKPRYSIEAYTVDLSTVITEVLRRTGEEFTVAQDVTGTVSLVMRNATAEEILDAVGRAARPPIRVTRGRGISVTLAPNASGAGPFEGTRRIAGGQGRLVPSAAPTSADVTSALQTPVSLDIADGRPVPISQALLALGRQAGIAIQLDARIPSNLGFAARVTRTPLMVVLETIAKTGALKWSTQPDGSVLIAPTDWMRLALAGAPLPTASSTPCPRCGRPIQSDWRYCPGCGQAIVHRPTPVTTPGPPSGLKPSAP